MVLLPDMSALQALLHFGLASRGPNRKQVAKNANTTAACQQCAPACRAYVQKGRLPQGISRITV
jgi:hypothetical protein